MDEIKLYENKEVRSVWDEEKEEWYFSVVDIVRVLSESKNPTDYLKKMRCAVFSYHRRQPISMARATPA